MPLHNPPPLLQCSFVPHLPLLPARAGAPWTPRPLAIPPSDALRQADSDRCPPGLGFTAGCWPAAARAALDTAMTAICDALASWMPQ
jgi:hypothetical protein